MEKFLQEFIYAVASVGLPIIITYVISYIKAKRDEKLLNIDNTYVKETIKDATNIVFNVVDTVAQKYVDDLKKAGKFDVNEQKEALLKAIDETKNLLNNDAINLITEKYNDLDSWIRTTIESYIKASKK